MDTPNERWQPGRDPIHRFIQLFDFTAGMVACHRWRPVDLPRSDLPPSTGSCEPLDPAAHPAVIESDEQRAALVDAAVAAYARLGQQAAAPVVEYAARLKARFDETYRLYPCPCQLCPDCGKRPRAHPCDFLVSVEYAATRRDLLRHLALGGREVPRHVRMRGSGWPNSSGRTTRPRGPTRPCG